MTKREIKQFGVVKPNFSRLKLSSTNYRDNFWKALNYAQEAFDNERLKKETLKWSKENKHNIDILGKVDKAYFATIGKVFYILNNEGEITDQVRSSTMKIFEEILERHEKKEKKVSPKEGEGRKNIPKTASSISQKDVIRRNIEACASKVCCVLDEYLDKYVSGEIDDITKIDVFKLMEKYGINYKHSDFIIDAYAGELSEFREVLAGKDPDLVEAYSVYKRVTIKRIIKYFESINEAAKKFVDLHIEEVQSKRKPPAELVSKLRYKKKDTELGIISKDVKEIIDAKQIWVFNTKTRKIGVYVAKDDKGLSVKSTTIVNYDEEKSVEKTLRNHKENISLFKGVTAKKMRENYSLLSTLEIKMSSRLNENCVVMKIEK